MKVTKEQLIAILKDIINRIEHDDSFQGNIGYDALAEDCNIGEFVVEGGYRFGNSDGQGCMSIFN